MNYKQRILKYYEYIIKKKSNIQIIFNSSKEVKDINDLYVKVTFDYGEEKKAEIGISWAFIKYNDAITLIPELHLSENSPKYILNQSRFNSAFNMKQIWFIDNNQNKEEGLYILLKILKQTHETMLQEYVLSKGYERVQYELDTWAHKENIQFQYFNMNEKKILSLICFIKIELKDNLKNDLLNSVDVQAKANYIYKQDNLIEIQSQLLLSPQSMVLKDYVKLNNMLPNQTFNKYIEQFKQHVLNKVETQLLPSLNMRKQLIQAIYDKYQNDLIFKDNDRIEFNINNKEKKEKTIISLNHPYPKNGLNLKFQFESNSHLINPQPKLDENLDLFLARVMDLILQYILSKTNVFI